MTKAERRRTNAPAWWAECAGQRAPKSGSAGASPSPAMLKCTPDVPGLAAAAAIPNHTDNAPRMAADTESEAPLPAAARSRGQVAVLAMLGLGLAAAIFAWWWNYERGQRALAFYGAEGARLIRTAPTVEILVLAPAEAEPDASQPDETIRLGGQQRTVARRIDISRAPGLLNARTSLLADASYAAEGAQPAAAAADAVLRFAEGNRELLLTFDWASGQVTDVARGTSCRLVRKTADGWRKFIARHVGRQGT